MGDINDDLFVSNSKLKKIIKTCNVSQIIDKPTRITENSATLLDVIITNNPHIVVSSEVIPCPIADHELVSVTLNLSKPKRLPETKTFRCLKNYSPDMLCDLILGKHSILNSILDTDNIDEQVNTFTEVFNECVDTCAPIVTRVVRRPPVPWITDEIKKGH